MAYFSICIPSYRPSPDFVECLRSIASQSFSDYEVVILDDGSPDPVDIGKYMALSGLDSDKVSFKRIENGGAYKARCRLLEMARGDVIMTVDSDDALIDSGVLARVHRCFEKTKADLVCYNITRDLKRKTPLLDYPAAWSGEKDAVDARLYKTAFASTYGFNSLCSKAVRRSLVHRPDSTHPRIQMGDDRLFSIDLISGVSTFAVIDEPLYFYRVAKGSLTAGYYEPEYYDQICYVESILLSRSSEFSLDERLWASTFLNTSANAFLAVGYNQLLSRSEKLAAFSSMSSKPPFLRAVTVLNDFAGGRYKKTLLKEIVQGEYEHALRMASMRRFASRAKGVIGLLGVADGR